MEITNEIKAKVFAQYLGQPMKCVGGHFIADANSMKDGVKIMSLSVMADCYEGAFKWSDFKLILKPLSAISDEDAIEIGYLNSKDFVDHSTWTNDNAGRSGNFTDGQFLQSRGYDLPQFLLNGKTLQEAGLAIYEPIN